MRKLVLIVVVAFALLVACGGQSPETQTPADSSVKIGVITIETGGNSAYGDYTKNGLQLALSERPDVPVKMLYADSKAEPLEAVRVFKELRGAGVPIVIGPFLSDETKVVGPEAQSSGVVLITTSSTSDALSPIGENLFMMFPPNSQQGKDQATYAFNTLGARTAALLYRQNPYGETLRKSFSETFTALGGTVVAEQGFPPGTEEFQTYLRPLAESTPDVVFLSVHDADNGRILRQAAETRFPETRFLGCDGSMTDTMLNLAGETAEGSIYSNVASVDPKFDERYETRYGEKPSPYAASAYDTMNIVLDLVSEGARTSTDFQSDLVSLKGHAGATGITSFTQVEASYWSLSKTYSQFVVQGGDFVLTR